MAVEARGLSKIYTLYPGPRTQLLDILGVRRLLRRAPLPRHVALNEVDLSIAKGERVGIIGRNGAGKTTLLKLVTGATEPTSGSLHVEGDVQALMQIGLGFHPEFTGRQNINASLLYSGLSTADRKAAEDDIITFCELGEYLDQPLKTYSLGMQSRLQFACATAIKPEILIVDEILGAGDAYFAAKSSQRMERLTKSGCTLLLVSHSMQQIIQFCERCIWMDGGRVRRDGEVRSVVGEYEVHMSELAAHLPGSDPSTSNQQLAARIASGSDGAQAGDGDGRGQVRLADGQLAHRWAAEPGVKLVELALFRDGKPVRNFIEGADIEFRGTVEQDSDAAVDFMVSVSIMRFDGVRMTRLTSPALRLDGGRGRKLAFSTRLSPCRLLAGKYFVNLLIAPAEKQLGLSQRRFDLLANFCDFEIASTLRYTEDGLVTHPSEWTTSEAAE